MSNEQLELEPRCVASGTAVEGLVSHTIPAADHLSEIPTTQVAEPLTGEPDVAAPPVLPASASEIAQTIAARPDCLEDAISTDRHVPARPPVQDGPFNTVPPASEQPARDIWATAARVTGMASAVVAGSHLLERYARPRVTAGPVISASHARI
jgi:hypothetical protein